MAAVNNWIISALSAEKAALPLLKVIEAKYPMISSRSMTLFFL